MACIAGALGEGVAFSTASTVGEACAAGLGLFISSFSGSGGLGAGVAFGTGKSTICANISAGTTTSTARINKPDCSAQIAKP